MIGGRVRSGPAVTTSLDTMIYLQIKNRHTSIEMRYIQSQAMMARANHIYAISWQNKARQRPLQQPLCNHSPRAMCFYATPNEWKEYWPKTALDERARAQSWRKGQSDLMDEVSPRLARACE